MATQNERKETIPRHIYDDMAKKLEMMELELDTHRQKSPLVGIRWYGGGGFGIGLTYPVQGVTKLALQGFNDRAVIDHATWLRIRNTEHAKFGLLVRDDTVIDELQILGKTALPDNTLPGPNSLTEEEATILLKGAVTALKKVVKKMDSHWGPIRLIKFAKIINVTDVTKLSYLRSVRDLLLSEFRWGLLHPHDLRLACENYKITNWEQMDPKEMIKELVKSEMTVLENQGD